MDTFMQETFVPIKEVRGWFISFKGNVKNEKDELVPIYKTEDEDSYVIFGKKKRFIAYLVWKYFRNEGRDFDLNCYVLSYVNGDKTNLSVNNLSVRHK